MGLVLVAATLISIGLSFSASNTEIKTQDFQLFHFFCMIFDTSAPHAVNAEPSCTWMSMSKTDTKLWPLFEAGRRLGYTQCPHTLKAGAPY